MLPLFEGLESRQLLSSNGFSLEVKNAGPFYTGQQGYFDTWVNHPPYRGLDKYVTVRWGDGTPAQPVETVPLYASAKTDVLATHIYEHPSVYRVHETVFSNGKIVEQFARKVHVVQHSPGGATLHAITGHALTAVFATFQFPFAFTYANVDFGDGTQAPAVVTSIGDNRYLVTASHMYARPAVYHAKVISNALPIIPYSGFIESFPGGSWIYSTIYVTGRKIVPSNPKVQLSSIAPATIYQDQYDIALASVSGVPTGAYVQPYALITWNNGQPVRATLLVDQHGNGTITATPDKTITGVQSYTISVFLNDRVDSKQNTQLGAIQGSVTVDASVTP